MAIGLLIGGAVVCAAAFFSSGDDDDDDDDLRQERIANLRAANERRHRQSVARKRAAAQKEERRRKAVREDFNGMVSAKFRAFKMKSRLGCTLRMTASDCGFRDFKKDCAEVTEQAKTAVADKFKEDRAECLQLDRQIKELNIVINELKRRAV